jgi:TonB-linked SusC/RagA family outer membrane protein
MVRDSILPDKNIPLLYEDKNPTHNIYSVSTVYSEDLDKTSSFSLFNSFKGRLSGYNEMNRLMRGYSSINQGPMLILLDGFEQKIDVIDNIDIEEIETVSIMKDAASTALFGQRAANGILSIKTKRGSTGKPLIKVEATTGIFNITEKPHYFKSYEYMGFYNEALQNDGLPLLYPETDRALFQNNTSELYPNTLWYDEALKDFAPTSKAGLTVRGGNENIKYFVFLNFYNKQGLYKNTEIYDYSTQNTHNRINIRSNFDIKLFEKTNIKVDIGGYLYDKNASSNTEQDIFTALQKNPPYIAGRYHDGVYGGNATYRDNPLAMISDNGYSKQHYRYYNANVELVQNLDRLTKGLNFHGKINIMNWSLYNDTWRKDYATEFRSELDTLRFGVNSELEYSTSITQIRNMGGELFFDYKKNWSDSKLFALLGSRISQEIQSGQNKTYSHLDFFGKLSFSNKNKYFADLALSYNGSQNFAPDKRFGFFPALSAGWLMSEEDWINKHFFKMLKLRASIGLTGSDYVPETPVDYRFMYLQRYYWTIGYNLGNDNANVGGIVQAMPPYLNAKWENSLKTNLGIDMSFVNNFNFSIDYFLDNRSDILVSRDGSVPSLIGIQLPLDNNGKVRSWGIETTLGYKMNVGSLVLGIDGYFNYYKSKIIEMNESPKPYLYLKQTGNPVGQFYGLESIGFFKDQTDIENSPKQLFSDVRAGDIKYKNQNGDNVIDEFDVVPIGKSNVPEILYAFSPSIEYKGFRIELLFDGVANRTVYLSGTQYWGFYGQANIATNAIEGRWTTQNPNQAKLPRLTTLDNKNNFRLNDIWLKDGSFLKLRNLEINYTFSAALSKKLNLNQLTVYLRGNNLYSFDHLENTDPENIGVLPSYSIKNIGFKLLF